MRSVRTAALAFVPLSAVIIAALTTGADLESPAGASIYLQDEGTNRIVTSVGLDRSVILAGERRPVYILVDFQVEEAASKPDTARPLMNLALVIDRSGSMEGRGKIEYAKESAKAIVDLLSKNDRLGIIEYDDAITVLWPSTLVESPELIKRQIDTLTPRGSTNLTGGMMKGAEEVMKNMHDEAINRVILLSDGLANEGVTDPAQIRKLVEDARRKGVTISDMGLGLEYDENLMQAIAESGGGNYYYIESPASMARIFREEMSILYTTVAKDGELKIAPQPCVRSLNVFGYQSSSEDSVTTVPLANFYAGEKRSVVIRLEIDAAGEGDLNLGALTIAYTDTEAGALKTVTSDLTVRITGDAQVAENSVNPDVMSKTVLTEADEKHEQIVRLFESGDKEAAQAGIVQLRQELEALNASLDDLTITKKLEALNMEAEQMERAEANESSKQQYLKASKQRLYYAQKGKRGLYLLREGDKGLEVENLQKALKDAGCYNGPIDGAFSADLTAAVKEFQRVNNLDVDGIAGPKTLQALKLY